MTSSRLRLPLALFTGLVLLAGCGSDENRNEKKENKKTPPERVMILRERFDQLENEIDEMERELAIQHKRIEKTRETAKAIRRSLVHGNLKGYSIDTITSEPMAQRMDKKKIRQQEKKIEQAEKEEAENSVLNALLIVLFFIFLIVIFAVALKDRKQDVPPYSPGSPFPNTNPDDGGGDEYPETSGSYGEIGGVRDISENPEPTNENLDNEDRHQ